MGRHSVSNQIHLKKIWAILTALILASAMVYSGQLFPYGNAAIDVMDVIRSSHHAIIIENPKNGTIYKDEEQMLLNFSVEYVYQEGYIIWQILSKLFYSFDGEPANTIKEISEPTSIPYRFSTFIDISNLSNGTHKIEVTASFVVDVDNLFVPTYNFSSAPILFSVFRNQPPNIAVISPENKTYYQSTISLNFTLDEPTSKIEYSVDGQNNVAINGNTTLTDLFIGEHNCTVYATDVEGNIAASETITFTVSKPEQPEPEPFPTRLVAIAFGVLAAIIVVGLLVYFKKRKH
jgi:hypothetical protein